MLLTGYLGERSRRSSPPTPTGPSRSRSSASTPASRHPPAGAWRGPPSGSTGGTFCLTYADGVADIDLAALAALPRRARAARDDDRGPPVQPVGDRADRRRRPGERLSRRSRGSTTGSTAASSAASRRSSTCSSPTACSSASRSSGSPPTASSRAYRHDGFWDCMDTYKDAVVLNDLWAAGDAALAGLGRANARRGACLMAGRPRHRRARLRRRLAGQGAARARRRGRLVRPPARDRAALGARAARDRGRLVAGRGRPPRRRAGRGVLARARDRHGLPPRRADDRRHRRTRRRCRASRSNVRGTWTLLEACLAGGVERVVVASSDKAYGAHDELPYREDFALQPTAPYEASKAAADLIARSYWHSYGLPVAVTRFANIYGGGDLNFSRLVPEAVSAALDGRAPVLRSDGSPGARLPLRRGRGVRVPGDRRRARPRGGARRGVQRRRRALDRVGEVVALIAKLAGWEPAVGLEEGLQKPSTGTASTRTRGRRRGPASPDPTATGFHARRPGGLIGSRHLGQVRVTE